MKDSKPDELLGRDIAGRYRIEAKIGEGGMGSVYRARNIVTGKVVAIKVLLQDLSAYDSFVQRFLHEARAAAYLNHPHAINIIDCGRDGDTVYLLMEYVEGRTLTEVMREEGPFSAHRTARILNQVCAAVAEAHTQSIVHRDLKPDNIMLQQVAGESDYVKVLDFGIAKVLGEQKRDQAPVSRNVFIGTPEYASPEQCNAKSPTALSDIYSLGVILYEMLTGTPPFTGDPMEVMLQHVNADPPSLRAVRPDLSEKIERTVIRALSKNPADRQQHVLQLAEEFEAAVRELGPDIRPQTSDLRPRTEDTQRATGIRYQAAMPTEIATPPLELIRPLRSLRLFVRSPRSIMLLTLAAVIIVAGSVFGYRFLAWYQYSPDLPLTPTVKLPTPPAVPANPVARARELFDQGNREGAVQALLGILAQQGSLNPDAHTLLGVIYADQGDYEGAISEFRTAIEQDNNQALEARAHLGQLLWELGREDEALETLTLVESGGSAYLSALVALGRIYLERNQPDVAEQYFTTVIRQARDNPEDILQVGKVLLLKKQFDLAVRELQRAMRTKQEFFPEAELYLGIAFFRQGDLPASAETLSRAISHRGGNYPAARLALGLALYQQKAYVQALSELRAALRLRGGNYPQAELMLGLALADRAVGRYEEARQQLQQAIADHGGRFPEAEYTLGLLQFFRLGQLQEARKIWAQVGDPISQEWLRRTEEVIVLQAAASIVTQRAIGARPLQEGHTITFEFAPLPGANRQPTITFIAGEFGWGVQPETITGGRASWIAFKISPDGRQPIELQPFGDGLMDEASAEVSVRVDRGKAVWKVNGTEIGQFDVTLPVQLLARISDGRAIIFNVRETSGQ